MENRSEEKIKPSDFIPLYGTLRYFQRNQDNILYSDKAAIKDAALFFYNVALIGAAMPGLEKLII